jgi:VWFA-related protein
MRHPFVMLLALFGAIPVAHAARRVTAAQFEQAVAAFHSRSDAEGAFLIADMQLTERLSELRVARLNALLTGEKSRHALIAVADGSEFQPPPPGELPATAAPDLASQRRIMGLTAAYVSQAIPQLPNFMATRETDFFEDTPLVQKSHDWSTPYEPLHLVGHSSVPVQYRDGREIEEPTKRAREAMRGRGLRSNGEFGPILAVILIDAAQNKLAFTRWEQGGHGVQAVFSYQVPKEKSHYYVDYCCVASEGATASANIQPFHEIVGHHGEMAVDPETGAILRLSVIAELKGGSPVTRADILVDYGPVEIGSRTYVCPVKAVSITTAQMVQLDQRLGFPLAWQLQPLKTMLNHVSFEQYHVFRSESRVLTAENGGVPSGPNTRADSHDNTSTTTRLGAVSSDPALAPENPAASRADAPAEPVSAPPPVSPPARPTSEPAAPEFSVTGKPALPDAPAQTHSSGTPSGFMLRTTARLVDVGLVAYDKKGHPVTNLKQSDFEIYDNGRRQEIKYFAQASDLAPPLPAPDPVQPPPGPMDSDGQTPALQQRTPATGRHASILLIDASNLAWGDLQYARQEMLRFLKTLAADEPVGLYILRSSEFQILLEPSTDHPEVTAQLTHWMPSAQDLARAQDEEQRNRQHFDWVLHSSDLAYVNGNDGTDPEHSYSGGGKAAAAASTVDPQLRSMGSNPQRDALQRLQVIARHLAAMPGHKSLVLVSSDNALADWSSQAAGREDKGRNFIDSLWLRAREALNEAHVSIYPLDASQLEAGVISADLENLLIQAKLPPKPGEPPPPPPNPTGRYAAQMHQDTHPIRPEFRELAEATGGRALRRAGDIAAELRGIAEDGRAAYQLSFTPDSSADDKYHLIKVMLTGRRDLTLHYRTGYLYENRLP